MPSSFHYRCRYLNLHYHHFYPHNGYNHYQGYHHHHGYDEYQVYHGY